MGGVIAAGGKKHKKQKKQVAQTTADNGRVSRVEAFISTEERTREALAAIAAGFESLHAQIERLLVAQERTNRLLELALQAGFEDEEQLRRS